MKEYNWICSQIGRRENYTIPSIINRSGKLKNLYTDLWRKEDIISSLLSNSLKYHHNSDIINESVKSYSYTRLLANRCLSRKNNKFDYWVSQGKCFSSWVANEVKSELNDKVATFGYTCANLELMRAAESKDAFKVHGQIDPGVEWYNILNEEEEKWGGSSFIKPTTSFLDRIRAEWEESNLIIVNSHYSKVSLVKHGVDEKKIKIVPLAYNPRFQGRQRKILNNENLRVLFVGNLSLAKGYQYFGEAAEKLNGKGFNFSAAGSDASIDEKLASMWPVNRLGVLKVFEVIELLKKSDVLVFPTLSDGFGMVQLEAMSMGLPVISTTNCASVVEDGISGFVVPPRNSELIVERLLELKAKPELYEYLSKGAIIRAKAFSNENVEKTFWSL